MNRAVAAALVLAALPLLAGGPVARAETPARPAETWTLAGIVYDPAAPLAAVEKPAWDPKNPPPAGAVRTYALTFAGGGGATVPADLSLPGNAPGKRPAILLLHGLGGNRKQLALLATLLNGKGYVTLAIDAAGHGDRPKIGGKALDAIALEDMRTLGAQTVVDLRRATDYLASRPDVDPRRIGFLGASLGGILGARFVSDEPRVAAAVFWAAGGNWGKLLTTSQIALAKSFRERGATDADQIQRVLADIDPALTLGRAAGRPLFFLHGDKDDIVPIPCNDALFAAAKDPKERVFLPGGHVPNVFDMASRSIAWLDKRLAAK